MSPVVELTVAFSTFPSLISLTRSENWGVFPWGWALCTSTHTRPTRHATISHRTAFLTCEFIYFPRKKTLECRDVESALKDSPSRRNLENTQKLADFESRTVRRAAELPGPDDLIPPRKDRPTTAPPRGYALPLE